MEEDHKELQLLPPAPHTTTCFSSSSWMPRLPSSTTESFSSMTTTSVKHRSHPFDGPSSLDLQLSISRKPLLGPTTADNNCMIFGPKVAKKAHRREECEAEALKWEAAEQIRLAALEKAYAERVRELTRREMELAQSQFSRAKLTWERARQEFNKADKMKERATRPINPSCMEVTCQVCRQKFRS